MHILFQKMKRVLIVIILVTTSIITSSCTNSNFKNDRIKDFSSKYKLDFPISSYFSDWFPSEKKYISIFILESKINGSPTILFNGKEVTLNQLSEEIDDLIAQSDVDEKLNVVNMFIGGNIKMGFVQNIKQIFLSKCSILVKYVVKKPSTFSNFCRIKFVSQYLPGVDFPLDELFRDILSFSNIIDLKSFNDSVYSINDSIVNKKDLSKHIKNLISKDSNYVGLVNIKENQSFSEFLNMTIALREAVYLLRNERLLQLGFQKYKLWDKEKVIEVRKLLPCREIEIYGNSPIITEIIILDE